MTKNKTKTRVTKLCTPVQSHCPLMAVNNTYSDWFVPWLAGIIDGDGNFDIVTIKGKARLKQIRIKVHVRDIRILNTIKNQLNFGRIRHNNNKPYCIYTVSTKYHMAYVVNLINGLIRLKVDSFQKACACVHINYTEAVYVLKPLDPYFAGLIDSDGTIIFNYAANRIECNLELKLTPFSKRLCLHYVVPHYVPSVTNRTKKNQTKGKTYESITFKYQTVSGMIWLYEYFMKRRLFCNIKFYRVSKIKRFLELRHYQNSAKHSIEFKVYSDFLLMWIQYENPLWARTPFVKKHLIDFVKK